MLQFRELSSLIGNGFRCAICGRALVHGSLADANRHCIVEHSINVVQYYKIVSEKGTGEGGAGQVPIILNAVNTLIHEIMTV